MPVTEWSKVSWRSTGFIPRVTGLVKNDMGPRERHEGTQGGLIIRYSFKLIFLKYFLNI